jgi:hypothetical protein
VAASTTQHNTPIAGSNQFVRVRMVDSLHLSRAEAGAGVSFVALERWARIYAVKHGSERGVASS